MADKHKKSVPGEIGRIILIALVIVALLKWLIIEPFNIPTPSMEGSLLAGDHLFVSKLHYGARTPKTLLQLPLPLSHQTIVGTDIPLFVDWIQLPQYRLPGFSSIKRGDPVVFNYPHDPFPIDQKQYWIKRCVAVPGDTLEIRDLQVLINKQVQPEPPDVQHAYEVFTKKYLRRDFFERYRINIKEARGGYTRNGYVYSLMLTRRMAMALKALPYIDAVKIKKALNGETDVKIFPVSAGSNTSYGWNSDFFGPLVIPGEGTTIPINKETLSLYRSIIANYEGLEDVRVETDRLLIDGQEVKQYTFKQNYYFMVGDNRHDSYDSRFWGFVPEDHVVGKALLVGWSVTPGKGNFFKRIRWDRMFTGVE